MGNTTDTFEAFCRDKGLTQADLDMIARELSARVASTTNGKGHYELPPVPDGFRPWSEDAAMVFKEDRSTTNDEQAKYGKEGDRPKQGAKWLPNSETFGHHVILLEQPKREPMLNYDWLGNMDDAAKGYVDNLREPLRSDPVVAGIALEAFKAGRNLPALELAKANTMIDKGVLAVVKTAHVVPEERQPPFRPMKVCSNCRAGAVSVLDRYCRKCGCMFVRP